MKKLIICCIYLFLFLLVGAALADSSDNTYFIGRASSGGTILPAAVEPDLTLDINSAMGASPIYRFWSNTYMHHFYTISESDKDFVIATWPDIWTYEGPVFYAYPTQVAGTSPVYRFWSDTYMGHFYTISESEKDFVIATWPDIWTYEGPVYYAYTTQVAGTSPVYRFWSDTYMGHFYTISEADRDYVIATWPDVWTYEGPVFYAYPNIDTSIDLPKTGQTKCYNAGGTEIACTNTGQDGDIQAGVAWPDPRFTVNGECVTDNLTGLMWAKNANLPNGKKTWQQALDYVASMNSGNGLCGYHDWRLPNVNELESLVNTGEANTSTWLIGQGFINVDMKSSCYWSSSTFAGSADLGWKVGEAVFWDPKDYNTYVWPVRAGQSGGVVYLPNTGQTKCYNEAGTEIACTNTGQDGDIQAGVAWPDPRFTVNGECVTDNLTGLMWAKNANLPNGTRTWQGALDYIASMNSGAGLCGFHEWRMPNRKELLSLIDYSKYSPALQTNHPFINVQSDRNFSFGYWSSSTFAYDTDLAWVVYMWDGSASYDSYYGIKIYSLYVWPVRAGQLPPGDIALNVSQSGSGTVTSNPAGINCGPTCSASYAGDTPVVLTAAPASGWNFSSWGGDCSGTSTTCTIIMNSAKSVTATFTQNPTTTYPLNISAISGSGTVTSNPTGINCGADCTENYTSGTSVTLTAAPASGWSFSSWGGDCSGTSTTCTITINSAKNVTVTFTQNPPTTYPLNISAISGSGTVTSNPTGINCGADCTENYTSGTSVTLTAAPASGWSFSSWGGDCSGTSTTCTITMNSAKNVTATFTQPTQQTPTISAPATSTGSFSVSISYTWPLLASSQDYYQLEESTTSGSSGFSNIHTSTPGIHTSPYTVPLTRGPGTYYYRARVYKGYSPGYSPYSSVAQVVVTSVTQTVTLKPQYDNLVMADNLGVNNNSVFQNAYLGVGCNWTGVSYIGTQEYICEQSLVKFNTSTLAGKTIDSATLKLVVQTSGVGYYPRNWHIRALATSWSPATVTWNVVGNLQYYTASEIIKLPPTYSRQIYEINVTNIVRNWANSTWGNNGLIFGSQDYTFPYTVSLDVFQFYPLEDTGGDWPKLIVTYH
jgi:hypothetical protein